MLAQMLFEWWFTDPNDPKPVLRQPQQHHMSINHLKRMAIPLGNYLTLLLSWNPQARPSAGAALQHPCFNGIHEIPNPLDDDKYQPFYAGGRYTPAYCQRLLHAVQ